MTTTAKNCRKGSGYLTTSQVAKAFKVCPRTVTKWFDGGLLKGFIVPGGKERRITPESATALAEKWGIPISWGYGILGQVTLAVGLEPTLLKALTEGCSTLSFPCKVEAAEDWFQAGQMVARQRPSLAVVDTILDGFDWRRRCHELSDRVILLLPEDANLNLLAKVGGLVGLKKPVAPWLLATDGCRLLKEERK